MEKDTTTIKDAPRQIEQLNIRLSILNAVSKIISSSLNLDEMLSSTIDKILDAPGSESVSIYVLNDGGKVLNLAAHRGLSANLTNHPFMRSLKPGNGLLGKVLLDGEPKVIDNTLQSIGPDVDLLIQEGFQSSVYIPLTTKGAPIGVMCVSALNPNTFSSEFVEFLTVIGNHIGVAVDNANMHKNIKTAYQDLKEIQEQIAELDLSADIIIA